MTALSNISQGTAMTGGFANASIEAAQAFRSALSAMSRPGTIETLGKNVQAPAPCSPAAAALILTLCDPDTSLYLAPSHDNNAMRDWVTFHTGARLVGPTHADFALGSWEALQPLSPYRIGEQDYPDRSVTLIVEMPELGGADHQLTGPGIETDARITLPEATAFQANRALFPLGFDTFLTCGTQVAGLPRSTKVKEAR